MTQDGRIDAEAEGLFARLSAEIVDSFTPEQRAALYQAAKSPTWRRYPVNIRLTLPLLGHRYFLTVVAGRERRSLDRLKREHRIYPLRTMSNLLFIVGVAAFFYLLALGVIVVLGEVLK